MRYIFLSIFCFILISCSNIIYQSSWQTKQKQPFAVFCKEDHYSLSCRNDETNIYIELQTNNIETINKIGLQGLSLWICEGRMPRQSYALHYPLPTEGFSTEILPEKPTSPFQTIALETVANATPILQDISELKDIKVKIEISATSFDYHAIIPMALLDIDFAKTKQVTISISPSKQTHVNYTSSMSSSEVIKQKLDLYKANPDYETNLETFSATFYTFLLSKNPIR